MEQWKAVAGYEGIYEVSDLGSIRSLDRKNSLGRSIKGRALKPAGVRYLKVVLYVEGKRRTVTVHRLVAEAFIGIPQGMHVDHIDGDKHNNRLSNLQVLSQLENQQKYLRTVAGYSQSSDYEGLALISPEGEVVPYFMGLPNKFGLKRTDLYRVLRGERKSHKGWRLSTTDYQKTG